MENVTIKEVSCLWKADKKKYVKESTYAAYVLILENHILPAFGHQTLVDENDVQSFVINKLESGHCTKTVRDMLVVLKMVVRFGIKLGCGWSTEWDIKFPPVHQNPELEVLSINNHRKILKYIQEHFTFKNLGIYICLSCGLRIGEVCALKWSDIDIDEGVVKIRKTIERIYLVDGGKRNTKLIISSPKTVNSIRDIPFSRELMRMMKPVKKVVNPDYYVLSNSEKPLEPRSYRYYYKSLMSEIGIPDLKFHGLRHSFATRCIESNCDYKTISVLLGHSSISTTLNLYVHPNLEQKKKCIDKAMKKLL